MCNYGFSFKGCQPDKSKSSHNFNFFCRLYNLTFCSFQYINCQLSCCTNKQCSLLVWVNKGLFMATIIGINYHFTVGSCYLWLFSVVQTYILGCHTLVKVTYDNEVVRRVLEAVVLWSTPPGNIWIWGDKMALKYVLLISRGQKDPTSSVLIF